ncbi:hypothetical protein HYV64_01755 [Candidatus Shapirobacteria bacterium]|nr:hypothetical protein [Candidatus Shapirobacteria bacterium]
MDQTQKPLNDQVTENTDLSKQYQDILNQYSKELQSKQTDTETTPTETTSESIQTSPVLDPLAQISTAVTSPEPTPVAPLEPAPATPPVEPPVVTSLPPMPSSLPPVITGLAPISKPSKNIFKYFFFVSLLVFLGIFGMIIYTVLNAAANPTRIVVGDNIPTAEPTNPSDTGKFCETNDKKIPSGETFPSADGCNTCTCGDDLTISCTEKDCSGKESTDSASSSVVPTEKDEVNVSDPIKTVTESINSQLKTTYKPTTLDKGKRWSVDLSKSSSKENITLIKKAVTDYGLGFQEDLSGEAGADWKETYVKSADTCTLEMMQGVLTLSCFN